MASGRQPGESPATEGHGPTNPSEPVPEAVVARAQAAFAQRSPGELAALTVDSVVDDSGSAVDHQLLFEHSDISIDVRVSAEVEGLCLSGVVRPPSALEVRLEAEGSGVVQLVDAPEGTFSFEQVPQGLVRLQLSRPQAGTPIYTDWFRLVLRGRS